MLRGIYFAFNMKCKWYIDIKSISQVTSGGSSAEQDVLVVRVVIQYQKFTELFTSPPDLQSNEKLAIPY